MPFFVMACASPLPREALDEDDLKKRLVGITPVLV